MRKRAQDVESACRRRSATGRGEGWVGLKESAWLCAATVLMGRWSSPAATLVLDHRRTGIGGSTSGRHARSLGQLDAHVGCSA